MADDLQVGDTVQLKSGGPKMTIERIDKKFESDTTNSAFCSWFDDKNKPQKSYFPLTSLNKLDPAAPPGMYIR
jgi:uncharacterized protein YodC (DUF2158 family)